MKDSPSPTLIGFDGKILTGRHTVVLETSKGDITLELDADQAPKTVTNFVVLAQSGYYNGLPFHRVIPAFMIQGGDPNGDGTGGESIFGPTFEDEPSEILMDRGVIAMANRGPDTNGSQFFIIQNEDGTPWLQGKHTAFGKVIDGMNIVDTIANVERDHKDQPLEPVTFTVKVEN
ncbi:peptidylprolyl isomerase [Candidatus Peregrinibacteria bacterium]|nr:peptidylprolyl isomerase [Candidatus Peregrinibacteria bacterium]